MNFRTLDLNLLRVFDEIMIERNLTKAGYTANPLEDGSLAGYTLHRVPMTSKR